MLKAGLTIGVVMVLLAAVLGYVAWWSVLCLAPLAGAIAGYWAAALERPATSNQATRVGAGAAMLVGVGALLGYIFSSIAISVAGGPRGAAAFIENFGFTVDISSPLAYSATALVCSCAVGLVALVFTALIGTAGSLVWYQQAGRAGPARPAG